MFGYIFFLGFLVEKGGPEYYFVLLLEIRGGFLGEKPRLLLVEEKFDSCKFYFLF